jgi:hypothetical protein
MSNSFAFSLTPEMFDLNEQGYVSAFVRCGKPDDAAFGEDRLICNDIRGDVLCFDSITDHDFAKLKEMFDEAPLYLVQLAWAFDRILLMALDDEPIWSALAKIFFPIVMPKSAVHGVNAENGELSFPFLDEISPIDLLRMYVDCLASDGLLENKKICEALYPSAVFDVCSDRFFAKYIGFSWRGVSYMGLELMLKSAVRANMEAQMVLDDYISKGRKEASMVAHSSAEAVLANWYAAEQVQIYCARLLVEVLGKFKDAYRFPFFKGDVFRLIECETMKQGYAWQFIEIKDEILSASSSTLSAVDVSVSISPQLSAALEQNADGKLDPFLERLLSRFLAREAGIQDALKGFLSSARAPA